MGEFCPEWNAPHKYVDGVCIMCNKEEDKRIAELELLLEQKVRCECSDSDACGHVLRAEKAEARVKELEGEVKRLNEEIDGKVYCNPFNCPKPVMDMEAENRELKAEVERLKANPMPGLTDVELQNLVYMFDEACGECYHTEDLCENCGSQIKMKFKAELARRQAPTPDRCPECGNDNKIKSECRCGGMLHDGCLASPCPNAWHDKKEG